MSFKDLETRFFDMRLNWLKAFPGTHYEYVDVEDDYESFIEQL